MAPFKWINRFFTIYVFDFLTSLGLPMGIVFAPHHHLAQSHRVRPDQEELLEQREDACASSEDR